MVATLLSSVYLTVITGQERFVFLKISGILLQTVQPLLVILCVMRLPYAMSVTAVIAGLNLVNILFRWWYVQCRLEIRIPTLKPNSKVAKEILTLSSAILIGCIADQIFWKTDQVILGKMFSTAVVAVYSVGAQIYMIYMQFGTQIAGVFTRESVCCIRKKMDCRRFRIYLFGLDGLHFCDTAGFVRLHHFWS